MRRRKRWIARGESSAGRSAARRVRASRERSFETGEGLEPFPEHDDQQEAGRVRRVDAVEAGERAAERLQEPELVRAAKAVRGEPLELGEDALAGRLPDAACRRPDELLGRVVEPEPELVLEPDRAQEAQRVVLEDTRADRAKPLLGQVGLAPVRVDQRTALE